MAEVLPSPIGSADHPADFKTPQETDRFIADCQTSSSFSRACANRVQWHHNLDGPVIVVVGRDIVTGFWRCFEPCPHLDSIDPHYMISPFCPFNPPFQSKQHLLACVQRETPTTRILRCTNEKCELRKIKITVAHVTIVSMHSRRTQQRILNAISTNHRIGRVPTTQAGVRSKVQPATTFRRRSTV